MPAQTTPSASATVWRVALLALSVVLGLTNFVELASTLHPGYWAHVGQIGLGGVIEHDKLRISERERTNSVIRPGSQNTDLTNLRAGDLVSIVPEPGLSAFGLTPSALEFFRFRDRSETVQLRIEDGQQSTMVVAPHGAANDAAGFINYYGQVIVDIIFALVGGLLAWRRPEDKAIRALAFGMICWSSIIPSTSESPTYDVLFIINQLTARVWVEVMLVYWAFHLSPASRWGISRHLKQAWPAWALISIALGFVFRFAAYHAFPVHAWTLHRWVDYNQTALFIASLLALIEGIFSTQGETRTRMRWALFVFGCYFFLFPYRIYVTPLLDGVWPSQVPTILLDNALQLILPLGLLYATLRHRLLDLSFAINRGLVYGALSLFVLAAFFGLEKLSESVVNVQGREQNALLAGAIAFGIFLFFHKVRDLSERGVERLFFSAWHRREAALREYVRSAAHITKVEALVRSTIAAVDRFTGEAGCSLYRRGADANYQRLGGSAADDPADIDADEPAILAMRVGRLPVRCADVQSALRQEWALPISFRGDVEGFMLLQRKRSEEAYRPDEIDLLAFAIQQIGLDLTALEKELYQQQASELEAQASRARTSAEEMRLLLQLALGGSTNGVASASLIAPEPGGANT
jgi:hypothetical protein